MSDLTWAMCSWAVSLNQEIAFLFLRQRGAWQFYNVSNQKAAQRLGPVTRTVRSWSARWPDDTES